MANSSNYAAFSGFGGGGGTGGFANPMTTTGDIIISNPGSTPVRLGIGSVNQVLTVIGGLPSWQNSAAGFANPMTTLGDIIFENATPAPARLAGSISGSKAFLTQTGTGAVSAAPAWQVGLVSGDIPNNAANTTGSAATWTTARLLAGNSVNGSANVPFANAFIVQGTTDAGLTGAQFLGALGTGIVKNTTATGVLSIAVAGDFPTLNQNTTGTASNITASSNSTITTLTALALPASQLTGTLAAGQFPALTGDVTTSAGSLATTIANNAVTNAKAAQMAANTIKGNNTGGTANAADLTVAQVTAMIGVTSGSTVSSLVERDANANVFANAFIDGYTSTVTAAGTTTLTVSSTELQYFTGTTTQTLVLPAANTLTLGQAYVVANNSTGIVTVNANGGGLLQSMAASTHATFRVTNISSGAGVWDINYSAGGGGGMTNPMTTTGDMIYSSPGSTPVRLPIGSSGQALLVSAGIPTWTTVSGTSFFASSQVTTASTGLSATSFTTFSNSPALSFTPTITGTYKVYSNPSFSVTVSDLAVFRIIKTSGTGTLLNESQAADFIAVSATGNVFIESVYTLTAGTAYVFDIQGKNATAGTFALDGSNGAFYMFAEQITSFAGGSGLTGGNVAAYVAYGIY